MMCLTAVTAAMLPHIKINGDMTEYLPSDSPMREGLDSLRKNFPLIDTNAPTIRVMFRTESDTYGVVTPSTDSLSTRLLGEEGIVMIMGSRQKDSLVMLELTASKGTDIEKLAAKIKDSYEGCVAAETNANSNMPSNMVAIVVMGIIIVFVILFAMCSSFMEALLFILTIGMAVVINMGTNALLPSVSMMTNTIVAVLQFVLSMDYSIILMNRYRQVRESEPNPEKAMSIALRKASASILSSSGTTIVGLLALVFMKFRIGLDLGIVLAKGVFFSLVSIYTILPALILIFRKAIVRTEKKVPLIRTDRLANFEVKYRYALAGTFVVLFAASFILQRRTSLAYASIWESEITDEFPTQTSYMLLYPTAQEGKVIELLDSIAADTMVVTAISFPSIMERPLTAGRMLESFEGMKSMLPAGAEMPVDSSLLNISSLQTLYYAISHPVRDERMSFAQIISLAEDASNEGLVPEGMNVKEMMAKFNAPEPEAGAGANDARPRIVGGVGKPVPVETKDTVFVFGADTTASADENDIPVAVGSSPFTYEKCNEQMTASELAEFLDSGEGNTKMIFRMAGKKGGTMSPAEFIEFVNKKIVPNKLMRAAISQQQLSGLAEVSHTIDSVLLAGPVVSKPDSLSTEPSPGTIKVGSIEFSDTVLRAKPLGEKKEEIVTPDTPMEHLAQMAFSGKRFTAKEVWTALHDADIDISREAVDLMFMYYGSRSGFDPATELTVSDIVDYLTSDSMKGIIASLSGQSGATDSLRTMIDGSLGQLRGERWSMAAVVTDYPLESDATFSFVDKVQTACSETFGEDHQYFIGEPVMYNEMKKGFSEELLFLTLLTVVAIFVIVAITFRSLVIPVVLVLTVLTGVFVNVFFSGLGGHKMLYLAYLIVQSILMGATIDYGILLTNYYRDLRRGGEGKVKAMQGAYKGSIHTIMTSGMILVIAPYVMSIALPDPTISSILSSLTFGALSALLVIIFLMPATLAAVDKIIIRKR